MPPKLVARAMPSNALRKTRHGFPKLLHVDRTRSNKPWGIAAHVHDRGRSIGRSALSGRDGTEGQLDGLGPRSVGQLTHRVLDPDGWVVSPTVGTGREDRPVPSFEETKRDRVRGHPDRQRPSRGHRRQSLAGHRHDQRERPGPEPLAESFGRGRPAPRKLLGVRGVRDQAEKWARSLVSLDPTGALHRDRILRVPGQADDRLRWMQDEASRRQRRDRPCHPSTVGRHDRDFSTRCTQTRTSPVI